MILLLNFLLLKKKKHLFLHWRVVFIPLPCSVWISVFESSILHYKSTFNWFAYLSSHTLSFQHMDRNLLILRYIYIYIYICCYGNKTRQINYCACSCDSSVKKVRWKSHLSLKAINQEKWSLGRAISHWMYAAYGSTQTANATHDGGKKLFKWDVTGEKVVKVMKLDCNFA